MQLTNQQPCRFFIHKNHLAVLTGVCVCVTLQGYDHGYYFLSTFIGDHIAHHAKFLNP